MIGRAQRNFPPQPAWSLLPNGQRIRGANVTPNSTQLNFDHMWGADGQWSASWMTNQIDWAKSLGFNTIGVHLGVDAIDYPTAGVSVALTLSQLETNATTVLNYIRSKGMYAKLAMGAITHVTTPSVYRGRCVSLATDVIANFTDIVVGVDLAIEIVALQSAVNASTGGTTGGLNGAWLTTNGSALRSAVQTPLPSTPLTFSGVAGGVAETNTNGYYANVKATSALLAGLVDFDEIHCYWLALQAGVLQTYWQARPKVKLLIGEAGSQQSVGSAANIAFYAAMNGAVGVQGPNFERCAGVLWWAVSDQDTVNTNTFGLFDGSGVVRTAAATAALAPT